MTATMPSGERLWRVRKDSRSVEAILRADPAAGDVELQVLFNRVLLFGQRWPTRLLAEDWAADKLRELQIRGWATHW